MIAAENGALRGGKVGGIGDVVRDVPLALAKRDCLVSVVIPAYGSFGKLPGAKRIETLIVNYAGKQQSLTLYHLAKTGGNRNVGHYVIEHPLFSACGVGKIYCDDPSGRPFATDASKFALFCSAVAEAIRQNVFGKLDILHLHDWHAALLLVLRRYVPRYQMLKPLHCTFTIHNLALQGIRPFSGDESSLEEWFPDLVYERNQLADPIWTDCVNPMACAIRLADSVHAVSPSYAKEILLPSDAGIGQHGGEGLEKDLLKANREKRLFGILNGCEYPKPGKTAKRCDDWSVLLKQMQDLVMQWASQSTKLASAHFIAHDNLGKLGNQRPKMLLTSVGRITEQKVGLMRQPTSSGNPALHEVLASLDDYAILLLIGSGDADYEQFLCETAAVYDNFFFLRGYSDELAAAFYEHGDLFFMPSSFEPCGISQMLALRAGQPCLVHRVGGLRDTIIDNKTGYVFSGSNQTEQADAMVSTVQRALTQHQKKSSKWQTMCETAAEVRFEWAGSVDAYLTQLYKIS